MQRTHGCQSSLFLFVARAPTPGATKTRLGLSIGMDRAAQLYRAFLLDLAARFTPAPGETRCFDFGWAYTPGDLDFAETLASIGCAAPTAAMRFVPQEGEGLGVRLENLFRWASNQGYRRTVIAASDSPQLPRSVAEHALAALSDHEVTIGRTFDGGYYLIGLQGFRDVLSGAPMSTGREADALLARAVALGLRVAELPPTFDVDEVADLARLRDALAPDGDVAPATWAALGALGLRGDGLGGRPGTETAAPPHRLGFG